MKIEEFQVLMEGLEKLTLCQKEFLEKCLEKIGLSISVEIFQFFQKAAPRFTN